MKLNFDSFESMAQSIDRLPFLELPNADPYFSKFAKEQRNAPPKMTFKQSTQQYLRAVKRHKSTTRSLKPTL
jgi:hypothetical protein